jgi:FdhD protein
MEIVRIGDALELAEEIEVTLYINGLPSHLMCTPGNLEELAVGFVVSEGLIDRRDAGKIKVDVVDNQIFVDVDADSFVLELRSSGCVGVFREGEVLPPVESDERFKLRELKEHLKVIEIEDYRRTRGYHTAAIISRDSFIRRMDVGRHNAVDKAIGAAIIEGINPSKSFLLLSGRISRGIAAKAVRAGIPLVVSKASVLDSAIDVCRKTGLSIVSFASGIAVAGGALILEE